jgi:hypothetical protein
MAGTYRKNYVLPNTTIGAALGYALDRQGLSLIMSGERPVQTNGQKFGGVPNIHAFFEVVKGC